MIRNSNERNQPLTHMQKDLRLAMSMADECDQTLPMTTSANEALKVAKRNGFSLSDSCALYYNLRK